MTNLADIIRDNEFSPKTINAVYEIVKDNIENSKIKYRDVFDYWFLTINKPSVRHNGKKYIKYVFGNKTLIYDINRCKFKIEGKSILFTKLHFRINNRNVVWSPGRKPFFYSDYIPKIISEKCRRNIFGVKIIPTSLIIECKNKSGYIVVLKYKNEVVIEFYYNPGNNNQIRWLKEWNDNLIYENQNWSPYHSSIRREVEKLFD